MTMYSTAEQRAELHASFGFTPFKMDLEKVFNAEHVRETMTDKRRPKRQLQEQARQEKRRGKIARAEMYFKMVANANGAHVPDDDVRGFEKSVIKAGMARAKKWANS